MTADWTGCFLLTCVTVSSVQLTRSTKLTQQVAVNTHNCPNPAHTSTHIQRMHTPTVCVFTHVHTHTFTHTYTHTHTHVSARITVREVCPLHIATGWAILRTCANNFLSPGDKGDEEEEERGRKKACWRWWGKIPNVYFHGTSFPRGKEWKKGCIPSVLSRWQIYCLNKIKNL